MRPFNAKVGLLPLVAALFLVGCGGKYHGTTNGNGGGANPFVGSYSGGFTANGNQDSGDLDFSVDDDRTITGTVTVPTLATNGQDVVEVTVAFTGTVTPTGESTGTFTGHSTSITTSGGTADVPTSITFSGTLTRTQTGATGTITRTADGDSETEPFTATLNQPI